MSASFFWLILLDENHCTRGNVLCPERRVKYKLTSRNFVYKGSVILGDCGAVSFGYNFTNDLGKEVLIELIGSQGLYRFIHGTLGFKCAYSILPPYVTYGQNGYYLKGTVVTRSRPQKWPICGKKRESLLLVN